MAEVDRREKQIKRSVASGAENDRVLKDKQQKKEKQMIVNSAYGTIVVAMKQNCAKAMDTALEQYIKVVGTIKPEIIAPVFRSLTKKEDIPYLEKWLTELEHMDIEIPENAYVCMTFLVGKSVGIIQFFSSLCLEKEALGYVNKILGKGLKVKSREYLPLLKSVSKRGDIDMLNVICNHMKEQEIHLDEILYHPILNTYINGLQPELFIQTINMMLKTIEVLQLEDSLSILTKFSSLYPRWSLRECEVIHPGICSICGSSLSKHTVSNTDKTDIAAKVKELIETRSKEHSPDRLKNFHEFQQFLSDHGPYDILLDGANIAHYKQNFEGGSFNYDQIQMLVEYLLTKGYKILIVLHEHHFGKEGTRLPEMWLEKELAFKVIRGNNDDWYWMYAAMSSDHNTMILSNDQMRDHFFQIGNDSRFQVWREHNQIYYDLWTTAEQKEFRLMFPKEYTQRSQKNDECYHFFSGKIEENMKIIKKVLCLVDTKKKSKNSFGGCTSY